MDRSPPASSGTADSIEVTSSSRAQCRDARSDEELVDRDGAGPRRSGGDHARAVHEQRRCRVGRRRGIADVAGKRRPIPDLDGTDDRRRVGEGLVVAPDPLVGGDLGHHRPGADYQVAVALADLGVELVDPLDIDDEARLERSVTQPDDQVCPTGERTGLGTVLGEQRDGASRWVGRS